MLVALGVGGSIAAYKACELVRLLASRGHEVRAVATPHALEFVSALTLQTLTGARVRSDLFSLTDESEISHIDLEDKPVPAGLADGHAVGVSRDRKPNADI